MNSIQQIITDTIQQGNWFTFLIIFWAAAVLSFSSCTLIRIPVVLGYIGGTPGSKRRAFFSVLSFVSGIIVSYIIAGILIGFLSQFAHSMLRWSRFLYYGFGILLLGIGLGLSGLVNFRFARFKSIDISRFKNLGLLGAFIFGLIFAFFEAPTCPCCAPALLIIAGLTFFKGKVFYGVIMFFVYALGQSFPILLIGTFTSIVKFGMPRIHNFERLVKFIGGVILIIAGIYCLIVG